MLYGINSTPNSRFSKAQTSKKMVRINKLLLATFLSAPFLLSSCGIFSSRPEAVNITVIEEFVQPGTTTLTEVRSKLGAPMFMGLSNDGVKFAAYGFPSNLVKDPNASFASNLLRVKVPNRMTPMVVKSVYFTLNDDNVITGIDYYGASYIDTEKINSWNEAERKLTPEEIREPTAYTAQDIYDRYFELAANEQGITVDELPDKVKTKEFQHCNPHCQTRRGAHEIFGTFKVTELAPKKLETDKQLYFFDNNPTLPANLK
ncbi:MAG: hypothetical protein LUC43_03365 [Burkholderiales bacterium]|nr:hypothetical protein [Burkholderiales bacterium]